MEDHESNYDLDSSSEEFLDDSEEWSSESMSTSTLEASNVAKTSIEKYYKNLFKSLSEREERY